MKELIDILRHLQKKNSLSRFFNLTVLKYEVRYDNYIPKFFDIFISIF